jgi:hypothetical protein
MQNNQRVKRVQLKINQINDFLLLGIVTSEPDYKLCLTLNKKFQISLKNISPVEVTDGKQSVLTFSRFSYTNSSSGLIFNFISNRSGKHFLLKKLKNIDYIFQVHDSENINNINQITDSLREIESVNAVFSIDTNTFKDKNLHYLTL